MTATRLPFTVKARYGSKAWNRLKYNMSGSFASA
jgi:hypothetical protein